MSSKHRLYGRAAGVIAFGVLILLMFGWKNLNATPEQLEDNVEQLLPTPQPEWPNLDGWEVVNGNSRLERLRWLVQHHPEPLVQQQLYQWIEDGTVDVVFYSNPSLTEAVEVLSKNGGKAQIYLLIGDEMQGTCREQGEVLYWMLGLYQASVNIQQMVEHPQHSYVFDSTWRLSAGACEKLWEFQLESNSAACELATVWHYPLQMPCDTNQSTAIAVREILRGSYGETDCESVFNELLINTTLY